METKELEKITKIRMGIQIGSLILVLVGSLLSILVGGLNFKGSEFKNIPVVIVGLVLFGIGILVLAVTEIYFFLKMKKSDTKEE